MAPVAETRAFEDMKRQYYVSNDAEEWERLDEMHKGIDIYLGHKLSLGPDVYNVEKILEIGCGSCAWAIQAAEVYPEAIVNAIDKSALPPRPLPSNIRFMQLDVTESLPFEPASFDIIHARYVFVHLPNWKNVLENVISLLKPKGWLWIEEIDGCFYDDQGLGPSLKMFNKKFLSYSRASNIDILVASSLASVLQELESLSEVHNVAIRCPTNGKDNSPNNGWMGQIMWASFRRALTETKALGWLTNEFGTSKQTEEVLQEAEDPLRNVYLQVHMTWSRKK
ncbi:hypothetical protein H2248_003766 [Termitomyces sp. 'cryptogamus']|nr:hypothetical protein H2248_003766 [Termitomyces sp. 'cryptogamus']